jgi:hypothetical protein
VDGRADQYALACLAYRLLTEAVPFPRDQADAVLLMHRLAPPPHLTALRPDLPGAADDVLAKAMAKAPDDRYESCGVFARKLGAALGVLPYGPPRSATALAPPQPTPALRPMPPEDETDPLTTSAKADDLYQILHTSARQPTATSRMRARRRHKVRQVLGVALALALIAAIVTVVLTTSTGTSNVTGSGSLTSESTFAGYAGQQGTVTVHSITEADGMSLAAGIADGHPAVWRHGAGGAWKLVSGSSPAITTLSGALTSIAYGPKGWIAVGNLVSATGAPVHAVTSGLGVNWQVNGAAFPGNHPSVTEVAVGAGGYVVVGTQVSSYNKANRIAAMWSSADLHSWTLGNNDSGYGNYLNGKDYPSLAAAVAAAPAGTFVAVGSGHGTRSAVCAVWTAVSNSGPQQWSYKTIRLPPGASSAALSLVTVNASGVAVAAGDAVRQQGGSVPIVVVASGAGQGNPIVLAAPGGQGTVTALTGTDSGFIVSGEIGPAGARHAVTWNLPDSRNPSSSWEKIAPVPVPGAAREITALYAAGKMMTVAAQQGRAEIATVEELPAAKAA